MCGGSVLSVLGAPVPRPDSTTGCNNATIDGYPKHTTWQHPIHKELECGTWYHHRDAYSVSWAEIGEFSKSQRDIINDITISKIIDWELVEWVVICRDLYQHRWMGGSDANSDRLKQSISAVRTSGGFPGNVFRVKVEMKPPMCHTNQWMTLQWLFSHWCLLHSERKATENMVFKMK